MRLENQESPETRLITNHPNANPEYALSGIGIASLLHLTEIPPEPLLLTTGSGFKIIAAPARG